MYMISESGNGQLSVEGSVMTKRRTSRLPKIQCNANGVGGVASPAVGSVCMPMVITAPFDQIGAVPTTVPMAKVMARLQLRGAREGHLSCTR